MRGNSNSLVASRGSHESSRENCFACFRPKSTCYCQRLPEINNQTEILILQHVRERCHAFNTARMAHLALQKSKLMFGDVERLKHLIAGLDAWQLSDKGLSKTGVLYPCRHSTQLDQLSPTQQPNRLILIDGTWPQARTMMKRIPLLQTLPAYHLSPTQPGEYRIRLEPNETSLSTVEAITAALRDLEPDTTGVDELIQVFHHMVEEQLAHPQAQGKYSHGPRSGRTINLPKSLTANQNKLVVVYGEAAYHSPHSDPLRAQPRRPVVWVAQRIATGETFSMTLRSEVPMTASFLGHLGMDAHFFKNAAEPVEFLQAWQGFIRDDEILVAFQPGTVQLLETLTQKRERAEILKSVRFYETQRVSVGEFLAAQNEEVPALLPHWGRSGKRLANTATLLRWLLDFH